MVTALEPSPPSSYLTLKKLNTKVIVVIQDTTLTLTVSSPSPESSKKRPTATRLTLSLQAVMLKQEVTRQATLELLINNHLWLCFTGQMIITFLTSTAKLSMTVPSQSIFLQQWSPWMAWVTCLGTTSSAHTSLTWQLVFISKSLKVLKLPKVVKQWQTQAISCSEYQSNSRGTLSRPYFLSTQNLFNNF